MPNRRKNFKEGKYCKFIKDNLNFIFLVFSFLLELQANNQCIYAEEFEVTVEGLAISWDKLNAFYVSLSDKKLGQ